jgi:hypothetical protein
MVGTPIEARISFRNDIETVSGFRWPIMVDDDSEAVESVSLAQLDPACLAVCYEDELRAGIEMQWGINRDTLLRTMRLIEE